MGDITSTRQARQRSTAGGDPHEPHCPGQGQEDEDDEGDEDKLDAHGRFLAYKPEPGMVAASLAASKFPAWGVAFISSEPIGLRRPVTIVLHPARLDVERSELKRAFCSSLSEL